MIDRRSGVEATIKPLTESKSREDDIFWCNCIIRFMTDLAMKRNETGKL